MSRAVAKNGATHENLILTGVAVAGAAGVYFFTALRSGERYAPAGGAVAALLTAAVMASYWIADWVRRARREREFSFLRLAYQLAAAPPDGSRAAVEMRVRALSSSTRQQMVWLMSERVSALMSISPTAEDIAADIRRLAAEIRDEQCIPPENTSGKCHDGLDLTQIHALTKTMLGNFEFPAQAEIAPLAGLYNF